MRTSYKLFCHYKSEMSLIINMLICHLVNLMSTKADVILLLKFSLPIVVCICRCLYVEIYVEILFFFYWKCFGEHIFYIWYKDNHINLLQRGIWNLLTIYINVCDIFAAQTRILGLKTYFTFFLFFLIKITIIMLPL